MMKIFKRNAVVLAVLLFVCVAVYLNWSFGRDKDADADKQAAPDAQPGTAQVIAVDQQEQDNVDSGLYFAGEDSAEASAPVVTDLEEYFAGVRLSRSQARDEATETLQVACGTTDASKETVDEATNKIMRIAEWTMKEADIENLIMAKGFDYCVAYITDDGLSVTVPAPTEGLSDASVARITDVVTTQTEYTAQQLKIIEIK